MKSINERPDSLSGSTYKAKLNLTNDDAFSIYVTINDFEGKPFEIFINSKNAKQIEHLSALTVTVSRELRYGIPLDVIAGDLKDIHSPFTGHLVKGKGYCESMYARIGDILLAHAEYLSKQSISADPVEVV